MTISTITPLPAAPDPAAPSTFSTLAAAFVLALTDFDDELNTSIGQMNTDIAQANTDAATATTMAATATTKAAEATASALTAVNAPGTSGTSTTSNAIPTSGLPVTKSFVTQADKDWQVGMTVKVARTSAPKNFMLGTIDDYDDVTGDFDLNVTHAQGTGTYTDWTISLAAPIMSTVANSVVPKSSGFTAYKYDKGSIYHCSAALTMAMDAVATLEAGWYVYVKNTGTSTAVTVDPNSSETINGASTLTIHPGETYLLYTDSSAVYAFKISGERPYLKVSDQKSSGTAGGGSTGTDITQTRTLNTTDANTISGASLSSDTITLPAGTYTFRIRSPFVTSLGKAFLYNTSDSSYVGIGSQGGGSTSGALSDSIISGRFTISASKNFKIRYYAGSSVATSGLGAASSSGQVEVYTEAEFWKEA